ncbi:MAG: class I SAM-dependent methyltransferase [Propionibacteriaceae bacterium]|nr:class I SAM-dependent methyltransferase [Propionibacteriaceae bacterium]
MNHAAESPIPAPTAESWSFAEGHSPIPDAHMAAREEAELAGITPISPGVAATLTVLAKATQARAVVEIGTGFGASALPLLAGMTPDGVITSIDPEAENQIPARNFLNNAGYRASRCRLIAGMPLEVLPKLRDNAYDIVFVNGDKLEYVEYVVEALRLLRPGGLLILNDALWLNTVADPQREDDETIIIREALEAVRTAGGYTSTLLTVGNGLLVAAKD